MSHRSIYTLILPALLASACTAGTPNRVTAETGLALPAKASIAVGATPQGVAFGKGFAYVANSAAGTISVIDTATDTKVTDLSVGGMPSYTTATPDGAIVASVDRSGGKVRLIDAAGGKHQILQTLDVGKVPCHAQWSADGKQLAVTLTEEAFTRLFTFSHGYGAAPDVSEFKVGTVAGLPSALASSPPAMNAGMPAMAASMPAMKMRGIAFAAGYLLVPNTGENNVSLVNIRTAVVKTLGTANSPEVIGLAAVGEAVTAIVGNTASHSVTIHGANGDEPATFPVGQSPADVTVRADGKIAFVTNGGSNDVSVIDLAARKEVTRVPVGKRPGAIYAPADAAQVWVMNNDGDSVTVLDAQSYRVLATAAVGKGKHRVAFTTTKAYVINSASNDVTVIERAAIK